MLRHLLSLCPLFAGNRAEGGAGQRSGGWACRATGSRAPWRSPAESSQTPDKLISFISSHGPLTTSKSILAGMEGTSHRPGGSAPRAPRCPSGSGLTHRASSRERSLRRLPCKPLRTRAGRRERASVSVKEAPAFPESPCTVRPPGPGARGVPRPLPLEGAQRSPALPRAGCEEGPCSCVLEGGREDSQAPLTALGHPGGCRAVAMESTSLGSMARAAWSRPLWRPFRVCLQCTRLQPLGPDPWSVTCDLPAAEALALVGP